METVVRCAGCNVYDIVLHLDCERLPGHGTVADVCEKAGGAVPMPQLLGIQTGGEQHPH